ncbi:hypothetical protein D8780_04490 [Notoacmeibacter ruber]|uniref:Succinoglycan biosynthesis protein exoi n=1 Tax=Notoacmeibacter ruber TaxID=2670375 RepID=A0A3L7JGW5_9HYPH|nr:hypothetical protein D8780_04490 [Notoacmeibacter ruber]
MIVGAGVASGFFMPQSLIASTVSFVGDQVAAYGLKPSCRIKGNVSINSGERIYHVPGQKFYVETNIDTRYGERYFCTEQEAIAAGWRKAHR